ncbi:MAG: hypothetical protein IJD52_01265 [Alphaproteobacteria bacterium]|nr:hypothetical protein [Alphaproteobacteria bacterium]
MHQQRGNFLLQALLALTLVFAFVPFLATRMAARNTDARMFSTTKQVETAQTAAKIFVRENINNLAYDTTRIVGNAFGDTLEPYGLPLGFVPHTALGQDIALIIHRTPMSLTAYLELSGGDLSELEIAELARRIGFSASVTDEQNVRIGIELQDIYSDIVRRNEPDLDNSGFLTNLDMGGFVLDNGGNVFAAKGVFDSGQFNTLSISGVESGRKIRNTIDLITTAKAVFQSHDGASALSLSRGVLYADSVNAKTVSKFGDGGNFTAQDVSVYDFTMTAGRTSFTGPGQWNVRGNLVADKINFSVERLDITSHLNATRGQDVYIDADTLEYSSNSGINVAYLYASNITMRDQTSTALNDGDTGAVILDIRPAGTSLLPDVLVSGINNSAFEILSDPKSDDGKTIDCKSVIADLEGSYNAASLSQYIICQYVYWQRLEKRIDIKQCLMSGNGNCG